MRWKRLVVVGGVAALAALAGAAGQDERRDGCTVVDQALRRDVAALGELGLVLAPEGDAAFVTRRRGDGR